MDKEDEVYTYDGILFGFKRNETLTHATAQMNLEDVMLGEIRESQEYKY